MFHQVYIYERTEQRQALSEDVKFEEAENLLPEDVKPACSDDKTFNEVKHEDEENNVTKDLVRVIKGEADSKPLKQEEEDGAPMTCLTYKKIKVFEEHNIKEENKEEDYIEHCADLLEGESRNKKEETSGFILCSENIQSTVLHSKDETLENVLGFEGDTDSEEVNSSVKSNAVLGSTFQILVEASNINEYITSDSIDPNPTSFTFVKKESNGTKLGSSALIGFSNLTNGSESVTGLVSKSNEEFPNCQQQTNKTNVVCCETVGVENKMQIRAGKTKYPQDVEQHPEPLTSLNNDEGITEQSCSPARDSDDSCSDWEQEYLASKEVCFKNKSTTEALGQAIPDQNKRKECPRLDSNHVIKNKSNNEFQKVLQNRSILPEVANVIFVQEKQENNTINPKTSLVIDVDGSEKKTTDMSSTQSQQTQLTVPSESHHKELQISQRVPRDIFSGTRDQSMDDSNDVAFIQSGSGLVRLSGTNISLCNDSKLVLRKQSNIPHTTEEVNGSISFDRDALYNSFSLASNLSAQENSSSNRTKTSEGAKCKPEGGQHCYSSTERLNQQITEVQLKSVRVVLYDCMTTSTDSIEGKQISNMDGKTRSISLRKRPVTAAFKYRDEGDSSSNVSEADEHCSDWEVDYLNSNDSNPSYGSCKKPRLEQRVSADRVLSKVTKEKDLASDASLSDIESNALLPNIYEKDPKTGIYVASENNLCSDFFSQLLNTTTRSHVNLFPDQNQKATETQYDWKDLPQKLFVCSVCQKIFQSLSSFSHHLRTLCSKNTIESEHQCDICGQVFVLKTSFTKHKQDLLCAQQDETTMQKKDLKTGIENSSVAIPSRELLNKTTSNINLLSDQKEKTIEPKTDSKCWPQEIFVCSVCKKVFQSSSSFTNHSKTTCFEKSRAFKFQCDICGKLFKSGVALDGHRNSHTNAKPYKCDSCEKCFHSAGVRDAHHKKVHLNILKYKYLCCFCAMTTHSIEHLKAHEETHRLPEGTTVPLPFKCTYCGKAFISNFKLKSHQKEHRPYKCELCRRKCSTKEVLEKHLQSHKSNEEFKCEICSKSFKKKESVRMHRRNAHTLTLQFFCDICDKGFKQKHHIEQHMISHSEERPISCPECDETFKRKTHLKQHLTSFHNKGTKKRKP